MSYKFPQSGEFKATEIYALIVPEARVGKQGVSKADSLQRHKGRLGLLPLWEVLVAGYFLSCGHITLLSAFASMWSSLLCLYLLLCVL